ncbi:RpiR family transcriptional regulator, partial [Pseudomonas syringae pv. coryli]
MANGPNVGLFPQLPRITPARHVPASFNWAAGGSCSITTRKLQPAHLFFCRVCPLNLLQHIAQSRNLLRKSELKVADHVLLDPAAVMHSSMADLAHSVGISEPTIVRFCRAIGCTGFQDLKLKLAQSLAAGASFGQFAIHEDDSVADYSLKIFDTTLHTLMEVRENLDPHSLQLAVTAMAGANRVEFYGFGASGAVAADAQHK